MITLKLTGAQRFIAKNAGIKNVLERGGVVEVTDNQGAYLLNLEKKDKSNNIHPLFVVTTEKAESVAMQKMTTQQRLAAAVAADNAAAEAGEEAEKPPAKKRRKSRAKAKPAAPVEPTETPAP